MIIYENECVGCPSELGCIGNICPHMNVPHYFCDECNDETQLYDFEGKQLCINCLTCYLDKIN